MAKNSKKTESKKTVRSYIAGFTTLLNDIATDAGDHDKIIVRVERMFKTAQLIAKSAKTIDEREAAKEKREAAAAERKKKQIEKLETQLKATQEKLAALKS